MHLSLALQPTDISILVGFTTALIGGYPKTSKHITRTLQTYRWFSYIFLNKSMVIFRFKYSRRWSSLPFCTLIQGVGTWLLWLGERVLKVSPKMDGGYGGPRLCSRCGGFSWSYWPKCCGSPDGGIFGTNGFGILNRVFFFAPKAETVEDPNASRQAPYSTKEVMKCPFVAAVGNCRATKSFHPFFIPKNDTHLD
jgi:hypothetical protein